MYSQNRSDPVSQVSKCLEPPDRGPPEVSIGIWIYTNATLLLTSGVARGKKGKLPPPRRNPGKFAKYGERPRPQPAIRIYSSRKL